VSEPQVLMARQLRQVVAALESGQAVALPGDGGYQLAVRHALPAALSGLRARGVVAPDAPLHIMVGRRTQASELAPTWSKETSLVTDRMWPGPLTVIVPAGPTVDGSGRAEVGEGVVYLTMPAWRPMRALCRRVGPLAIVTLRGADGEPLLSVNEVGARLIDQDVAFVVDGGPRGGLGPTVVDCTVSPPTVHRVGALPESYVEAALLMGLRRRSWFAKRTRPTAPT
jgi:L-threonylcarbamoyladenylate synthase